VSRERARVGREGEERAARFLESAGLRILERGWRCVFGEIDIVAVDGQALVFVEVKARLSAAFGPAEAAVGARKQARLVRAGLAFAMERDLLGRPMRFDVVAVQEGELRHVRDAFSARGYTV
jgi:putative endonuclease